MKGEGAHAVGGRWNSPGHHVVYTSGNVSLATLELLVHIDDAREARELSFVYHSVSFPAEALAKLSDEDAPSGWDSRPEATASQGVGDQWLEGKSSVVLAVPSVVTPRPHRFELTYMNYLVNPLHPDFETLVEVGAVLEFELDDRLV